MAHSLTELNNKYIIVRYLKITKMQRTAQQIHNHLQSVNKITLVSHPNPDGDTLGAAMAFAEYLRNLKKEVKNFCLSPVPEKFGFLNNIHLVSFDPATFLESEVITVLDCGDLRFAGIAEIIKDHPATLVNIDHHATNEKYGHLNMVIPNASSTTEVVYNFFKFNNIYITRTMATALLTGLITDTDNFSNSATSYTSLTAASDLLRLGANWTVIHHSLVQNKSIAILKLWGLILSRLHKKENSDMAYTYLTIKDLLQYGISDEEVEGISNFLNKLDGAKISLFIKETADGKIKGSFRTTSDEIDVSALAKKMGGGGHKKAAGFTTDGTIESVVEKIINLQSEK
ncbi:MAG TPA: bifunctional oligoribonuclease/PAP phosphatase NrnA [Candidatus Udaeobacter sp.]|nr:bifunctional oligoribonuclease/PAP phosphatase NrnA [Candidatus Udaeobacter sp.]